MTRRQFTQQWRDICYDAERLADELARRRSTMAPDAKDIENRICDLYNIFVSHLPRLCEEASFPGTVNGSTRKHREYIRSR